MRIFLFCFMTSTVLAQSAENPISGFTKGAYLQIREILLHAAEKMPEENYAFKPTDEVRSFGDIVGHLTETQYMFCSMVQGVKNPAPKIEGTRSSKVELVSKLKESYSYCDAAYDGMTDATGAQMMKLFGNDSPKLGVLTGNNMHMMEHYGNMVTYMRIKKIVPPTSEPGFQFGLKK